VRHISEVQRSRLVFFCILHNQFLKNLNPQEDIHQWRAKIASSGREWAERNGALRREKELMARHYSQLRAALDATRRAPRAHLGALARSTAGGRRDLAAGPSLWELQTHSGDA
jgi:hypothetical protein